MLIDFDTIIIFYVGLYTIVKIGRFVTGHRNSEMKLQVKIMRFIFGLYITVMLGLTIFPVEIPPMRMDGDFASYLNFHFFSFMQEGWNLSMAKQVFGNILLFVPVYPLAVLSGMKTRRGYQVLLGVVVFSLSIEVMQFVENITGLSGFFGRVTDVNDLFLNTLGGMIGFVIVKWYHRYKVSRI